MGLYDMLGHRVADIIDNKAMQEGVHHLQTDVSGLEPGIYLLRLTTREGVVSRKLIVR